MFPHRRVASSEDVGEARQRVSHGAGARASVRTRPRPRPRPRTETGRLHARDGRGEDEMRAESAEERGETPERLGLVRDVVEEARGDFVHPLAVANLGVVQRVRGQRRGESLRLRGLPRGTIGGGVWVSDRSSRSSSDSAARSARQCAAKGPRRNAVRGTSARMTGAASVCVPRSSGGSEKVLGVGVRRTSCSRRDAGLRRRRCRLCPRGGARARRIARGAPGRRRDARAGAAPAPPRCARARAGRGAAATPPREGRGPRRRSRRDAGPRPGGRPRDRRGPPRRATPARLGADASTETNPRRTRACGSRRRRKPRRPRRGQRGRNRNRWRRQPPSPQPASPSCPADRPTHRRAPCCGGARDPPRPIS